MRIAHFPFMCQHAFPLIVPQMPFTSKSVEINLICGVWYAYCTGYTSLKHGKQTENRYNFLNFRHRKCTLISVALSTYVNIFIVIEPEEYNCEMLTVMRGHVKISIKRNNYVSEV
jgi:hypothetical protein